MSLATRLRILALAFLPFLLGAFLLNLLSRADIIARDPIPFDGRKFKAVYRTDAGEMELQRTDKPGVFGLTGELTGLLTVNQQGMSSASGRGEGYTPFWLHFSNPVLTIDSDNPQYTVIDSFGVLGPPNLEYTARQEGNLILMDEILQSQASLQYGIFDENNSRAATAIYDGTSGLLFRLQVKQPDKPDLRLIKTNFPISRNRVWLVLFYLPFSALLVYLLVRRAKRKQGIEAQWPTTEAVLVLLGVLCVGTDTMLDIWYPFLFGRFVPVIWHIALAAAIVRLGGRASVAAIAEVVMVFALWFFHKGPAQTFFYIPGSIASFILLLGSRRYRQPSVS